MLVILVLLSPSAIDGRRYHRRFHSLELQQRQQIEFPKACVASIATGSWIGCAVDLGKIIWSLHTWSDDQAIKICNIDCTGNLKGRIHKLEWVWDGKFQCETRAPGIAGEGRGKASRQGAMEEAIKEFILAAIQAGSLKAEDFKC
ncbi:unnamed protein product [Adineta steineri]|uniref:Uncharacterized protein n=1 Tax=Adineta steineri TaxID=433720 RepID=A0A819NR00_9BILA|nr:unnamed protein product [Adineta steineri]CAF4001831.1 unnamed protein product [Adineta steineri]